MIFVDSFNNRLIMDSYLYRAYFNNTGDLVTVSVPYNRSFDYVLDKEKNRLETRQSKLGSDIKKITTYQKTGWCLFFNIVTFFALRCIQTLIINHKRKVLGKIRFDLDKVKQTAQNNKFFETKYTRSHAGHAIGKAFRVVYANDPVRLDPLCNHFLDEEIVKVCNSWKDQEHSNPQITIFRDEDDKVLIEANGRDGSEQACFWMLVADNGGKIYRDLGRDENYGMSDFFKFIDGKVSCDDMDTWMRAISDLIKEDESMIVYSGGSGIKGLPFIIDEVLEDGNLQIRDPYHFWTIVVKPEAVRKRMNGHYTQIRKGRAK